MHNKDVDWQMVTDCSSFHVRNIHFMLSAADCNEPMFRFELSVDTESRGIMFPGIYEEKSLYLIRKIVHSQCFVSTYTKAKKA